jgi:hypothetical protein
MFDALLFIFKTNSFSVFILVLFLFLCVKFKTVAQAMLENFALISKKTTASKITKTYLF